MFKAGYPGSKPAAEEPVSPATEKLYEEEKKKPFWRRGKGFKAYTEGAWKEFAPSCQDLLTQAYTEGCPSMRLNVKGHMYKFDFKADPMEMRNLNTLEISELRAAEGVKKPDEKWLFSKESFMNPLSKGLPALREKAKPQRPVFIVRVPKGGPGTVIEVPHPKKLGRAMQVAVPKDANIGDPLFIEVPRTTLESKLKYGAGGGAAGAAAVGGVVVGVEAVEVAAVGGAGVAAAGGIAAAGPLLGGLAVGGLAVAGAGAAVHYATKNPGKAVAVGALTIGGLAFAAHVDDVGLAEAVGDVADGAKDLVVGAGDVAEDVGDFIDDLGDLGGGAEAAAEGAGDAAAGLGDAADVADVADAVADAADGAGDGIADAADGVEDMADVFDAGAWIEEAGEDTVDIILDLF